MARTSFGFYFIPEPGELYDRGSAVVGYDIRAQQTLSSPAFVRSEWNTTNREYGFHITITDAIQTEERELPRIVDATKRSLTYLDSSNIYNLKKTSVGFWPAGSQQVAIRLTPNRYVELLHDLLVLRIHPMGQGSVYSRQYRAMSDSERSRYFDGDTSRAAKTEDLYSPYVLDKFTPHLTCVNPFSGTEQQSQELVHGLEGLFTDVDELTFDSLSMVTKAEGEPYYRIIEEFSLRGIAR